MQHFRFMWLHTFLIRNFSNRCMHWCYQSISRIFGWFILFGPILSRGLVPRNATIALRRSHQILATSIEVFRKQQQYSIHNISFSIYLVEILRSVLFSSNFSPLPILLWVSFLTDILFRGDEFSEVKNNFLVHVKWIIRRRQSPCLSPLDFWNVECHSIFFQFRNIKFKKLKNQFDFEIDFCRLHRQ